MSLYQKLMVLLGIHKQCFYTDHEGHIEIGQFNIHRDKIGFRTYKGRIEQCLYCKVCMSHPYRLELIPESPYVFSSYWTEKEGTWEYINNSVDSVLTDNARRTRI